MTVCELTLPDGRAEKKEISKPGENCTKKKKASSTETDFEAGDGELQSQADNTMLAENDEGEVEQSPETQCTDFPEENERFRQEIENKNAVVEGLQAELANAEEEKKNLKTRVTLRHSNEAHRK